MSADHRHALATIALAESSLIEIDAFPAAAVARPPSSIGLPSGIAMVSLHADGPLAASSIVVGRAGEWIEQLTGVLP